MRNNIHGHLKTKLQHCKHRTVRCGKTPDVHGNHRNVPDDASDHGVVVGFLVMIPYVPIIVIRVKDEEELLTKELPSYEEYKKKVKWRLHQYIW